MSDERYVGGVKPPRSTDPLPDNLTLVRNWQATGIKQIFEHVTEHELDVLGVLLKDKADGVYLRNRMNSWLSRLRKRYAKSSGKTLEHVKQEMDRFRLGLRVTPSGTWVLLVEKNPQVLKRVGPDLEVVKGSAL